MQLITWLVVGFLSAWRITHDLTNDMALDGPFNLYTWVRAYFQQDHFPKWLSDGITCPYCVSFWMAHLVAVALPVYQGQTGWRRVARWLLVAWAIAGAIVVYLRHAQWQYGIDAGEV